MGKSIRQQAVAGFFYPDDPERLKHFLNETINADSADSRVRAIIVPHAGYSYSGPIAGNTWSHVNPGAFERVILLGPAHTHGFTGISVAPYDEYQSPLGVLTVDTALRDQLAEHRLVSSLAVAHRQEHCLEVQMPFIKTLLPEAVVLPIVCGGLNADEAHDLAQQLRPHWDDRTLIVISTDFTHYGQRFGYMPFPLAEAHQRLPELDGRAIDAIQAKDPTAFHKYLEETEATICGRRAIEILLHMLGESDEVSLVQYDTSGNLTGDYANSVSYAGLIVRGPHFTQNEMDIMLQVAKQAIKAKLHNERYSPPTDVPDRLYDKGCSFVTLRINGNLRGCIGCLEPRSPLLDDIAHNAVSAAFYDSRFPSLGADEFDSLEYHISVLTPARPIPSYSEIVLGKHGIILMDSGRRAVFLPEVATEQGWDLRTTLEHLSVKAGLPADAWKTAEYKVFETVSFGD